jgi:hypothetical protein
VASTSAGNVSTSPNVETSGAVTLSRSQANRVAPAARATAAASTTIEPSRPPTIEMVPMSSRPMRSCTPKATASTSAMTASTNDTPKVRIMAASTFCTSRESRLVETRNVPACRAVLRRLPSAPKTLPRRPMAAGTSSSRPG